MPGLIRHPVAGQSEKILDSGSVILDLIQDRNDKLEKIERIVYCIIDQKPESSYQ